MAGYTTDEDRQAFMEGVANAPTEDDAATPEDPGTEEYEGQGTPDEGDEVESEPVEPGEGDEDEQPDAAGADPMLTVKIGGRDVMVPQSELVRGYLRQDDYTRKTQQLAQQRQELSTAAALVDALDANPAATIRKLVEFYELDGEDVPEGPSPEVARLSELEQWQAQELNRQREAAVDAEVTRLHQVYGDFNDDDLFGYAVANQVLNLEAAYRAMSFGRQPPATNGARTEKRKVAAVAGGSGRNGAAVPKSTSDSIRNFRDAYDAAKRELSNNAS